MPIPEIPSIDDLAETELSNLSVNSASGSASKECDINGESQDAGKHLNYFALKWKYILIRALHLSYFLALRSISSRS